MSWPVSHIADEIHILVLCASQKPVHSPDEQTDYVYVLPLVESADIVGLGNFALMENQVDGPCVVFHIEPVPHILAPAIDRKRLAVTYIIDEQGNKFLWELIWTIVVGTVGHNRRHSVGVVEGSHEMVG